MQNRLTDALPFNWQKCLVSLMCLFYLFQLQESLCTLNFIDLVIKLVTLVLTYYLSGGSESGGATTRSTTGPPISVLSGGGGGSRSFGGCSNITLAGNSSELLEPESHVSELIIWTGMSASVNIVLIALAFWIRFANLYLHWGALATWCLLFLQGKLYREIFFIFFTEY
jgi:hypothetical protein